jgi:hypothetical protein
MNVRWSERADRHELRLSMLVVNVLRTGVLDLRLRRRTRKVAQRHWRIVAESQNVAGAITLSNSKRPWRLLWVTQQTRNSKTTNSMGGPL